MDSLLQDIRFAVRNLRKNPGFTLIAAVTLALGIGTNTTIFSVVEGVLIKPYPFHDPDRLVVLYETRARDNINRAGPSYQDVRDWQRRGQSFSDIGIFNTRSAVLTGGEDPVRLIGGIISWNLFPMLGISPVLGRQIREDEDRPGAAGVVLLGHELWRRRYLGDSGIIGRVIQVNTEARTVIGVMPPKFRFPETADLWIPIDPIHHDAPRAERGVGAYARLKPGVTVQQADAELAGISGHLAQEYPASNEGWSTAVRPIAAELTEGDVRLILLTMMGAVTFVLLIAASNVANLLLARATARRREIAIRAALGAGRWRIVRQLLTESVIVALAGGAGGILLAFWGTDLIWRGIPPESNTPYYITWSVDGGTLLYTLAVAVIVGVAFGLAPALAATRGNLQESLKEGGRGSAGSHGNRLRSGLVIAEVALSLILLVGASLFVRSFMNAYKAKGGIETAQLMTLRLYMPGETYRGSTPKSQRVADVIRRVEAVPGVIAAAASNNLPLSGGGNGGSIEVEGRPRLEGAQQQIFWTGVTPHWFRTLDLSLLSGRDFTDQEGADSSRVAVINQTMAKRFWPDGDPLGRRFRFPDDSAIGWVTVIGVIPDYLNNDVDDRDRPASAYLAYPYLATPNTGVMIRVAAGDPAAVTAGARQAIRASDPGLPVFQVYTMEALRQQGFWQYKLFGWMFSIFGGIALVLAAVGVYGVLAYNVTQRTQEIGVRMALGAKTRDVLRLVVGQGVRLALFGVAAGLVGAFGVTRVLVSILFEVSPADPVSFGGVAFFLTAIAALASYLPARRAMEVDPIVALRYE